MDRILKSLTASAASAAALLMSGAAAVAQTPAPPQAYPQQSPYQQQPYQQQPYQQQPYAQPGYGPPPPNAPPPPGYEGQGYGPPPPPGAQGSYADPALQPPPGYTAQDAQRDAAPAARDYDRAYAAAAEQWSAANCVRQEQNRTAAGAIIGGVLGAVIGSSVAGRHDAGAGAVVGGTLGAVAGGAIANTQGPACPPGFVLRAGAPAFYPPPAPAVVVYEAPTWYNPWIWYDGHWMYRPYPYHRYWREHHPRYRYRR